MCKHGTAPILVLGLGNTLLGDDGAGIHLLRRLARSSSCQYDAVEYLEGGTQGLALLGPIAGRDVLVLLDAAALGAPPGTVHVRYGRKVLDLSYRSTTAHEGNAGELLAAAMLLGDLPGQIFLVGIEPACLESGMGLSKPVQKAILQALKAARRILRQARSHQAESATLDVGHASEWCRAGRGAFSIQ